MDPDNDWIYDVLADENYPITLADLNNPTSQCIVNFLQKFLGRFLVDTATIQRATFGQEQIFSYRESHDETIGLMNLHVAISNISQKIFLKDFSFVDMTSPGVKKTRRLIWTLLNFEVFTNNKFVELADPLDATFDMTKTLNDFIEKKNDQMKIRKEIVLEISKKTALEEKNSKLIEELKKIDEQPDKRMDVLAERVRKAKMAMQQLQQEKESIKQQVSTESEKIIQMEESVVKSPEKYETELSNFTQDCRDKQEKLQIMIERLRAKQDLHSQFERVHNFIDQEKQKIDETLETCVKHKSSAKSRTEVLKQLKEMQVLVKNVSKDIQNLSENIDLPKVHEGNSQSQEDIAPLLKLHTKFLGKIQDTQRESAEAEICGQKFRFEKDELHKRIIILEEEISGFLKDCQNLYTNDITEQLEIQKPWKRRFDADK